MKSHTIDCKNLPKQINRSLVHKEELRPILTALKDGDTSLAVHILENQFKIQPLSISKE